jgi:hypothetical protein
MAHPLDGILGRAARGDAQHPPLGDVKLMAESEDARGQYH